MAITIGNKSNSGAKGSVTNYTWNHTCNADTSVLVILPHYRSDSGSKVVNALTYDSVAATSAGERFGTYIGTELWYLANPAVGSELVVSVTHPGAPNFTGATAVDLIGTATTSPLDIVVEDSGTGSATYTLDFSARATDSMVVGGSAIDDNAAGNIDLAIGTLLYEWSFSKIANDGYNLGDIEWDVIGHPFAAVAASFKIAPSESGFLLNMMR